MIKHLRTSSVRHRATILPARLSLSEGGFTDIVGYTAMMGSDEDRAFALLHQNREIPTELIQTFKGKRIKK